eukprot:CCRYP_004082-RA/>CCRYP_004082-RA protein AED:0.00 eAED:0.00 QI:32/1/1/1/0/0/2/0/58
MRSGFWIKKSGINTQNSQPSRKSIQGKIQHILYIRRGSQVFIILWTFVIVRPARRWGC